MAGKGRTEIVIVVKEKESIVNKESDDSSFAKMIDNGLNDSENGKLTSHGLVMEEIESWSK